MCERVLVASEDISAQVSGYQLPHKVLLKNLLAQEGTPLTAL